MKDLRMLCLSVIATMLVVNCGGVPDILSTPIENIDNTPIKEQELTEKEKQTWGHLDLIKDTIPGMSVDKAYAEILNGRSGQQVVVAIIDSGIDIDHEDLDGVIWRNSDEIAGNNKDDDRNGYV
ncbi:MAG: peptidase S8, partial [Flavobacteriaceae bacterium]|nr:peptidase S8 [Bacteroidia bacterium]NNL62087.1 peptidase S8 [Flavobacteriaceae bacterium]